MNSDLIGVTSVALRLREPNNNWLKNTLLLYDKVAIKDLEMFKAFTSSDDKTRVDELSSLEELGVIFSPRYNADFNDLVVKKLWNDAFEVWDKYEGYSKAERNESLEKCEGDFYNLFVKKMQCCLEHLHAICRDQKT